MLAFDPQQKKDNITKSIAFCGKETETVQMS